jgi:iron complex outermembrane recepter protein
VHRHPAGNFASFLAFATAAPAAWPQADAPTVLPAVTVTATRVERESFELPAAIDVVEQRAIHEARPQINLSEPLAAVPGVVVQNRHNYAQDLQISSRGFGARATFGVRGIRLLADGIPATMPDGQGQAASFNLDTAERIEVLRGPFATLYGNASGGVIQIFTADGPPVPTVSGRLYLGSHDTSKWVARYGGEHGALNVNASHSAFRTGGYREHSAARRDHSHAKLKLDAGAAGVFTLIPDRLDQPDSQDPQGLTATQLAQNPRQASTAARLFNTRKTVRQNQVGLVHDLELGARNRLQTRAYVGDRAVLQFLGLRGDAPTASGGVVDLDRGYGGGGIRWSRALELARASLDIHIGVDHERMKDRRRGFVNEFGIAGALARDEDNIVSSTGLYTQAEWRVRERWLLMAGVRYTRVDFEVRDYFVTALNPDDSGSVRYTRTSPVGGVSFEALPGVTLYANAGQGFETPTFTELAYRSGGAPGLNFGLRPAVSTHTEVGAKLLLGPASQAALALYRADVRDEIVVESAMGGRTVFRNAARTRREGVEVSWQARWGQHWEAAAAYTRLDARFTEPFTVGTPPVLIAARNRLPGVPVSTLYGELIWRDPATGFHAGAEVRRNGRVYVDDANSEAAAPYTIANVRIGFEQRGRRWRLTEFVRLDNITDRSYVGSVIVNAAARAFYEPAPRRSWLAGVTAELAF